MTRKELSQAAEAAHNAYSHAVNCSAPRAHIKDLADRMDALYSQLRNLPN